MEYDRLCLIYDGVYWQVFVNGDWLDIDSTPYIKENYEGDGRRGLG